MLEAIKKIDSFPKALDDFRVKTTSGAVGDIHFNRKKFIACFLIFIHLLSFDNIRHNNGDTIFLRAFILL